MTNQKKINLMGGYATHKPIKPEEWLECKDDIKDEFKKWCKMVAKTQVFKGDIDGIREQDTK